MSDVSVAEALRRAVGGPSRVIFPREFQGFVGTVHGGGTAAFFLDAAGLPPGAPARLDTVLGRTVPVECPLEVVREAGPGGVRLGLRHEGRLLAEGVVGRGEGLPLDPSGLLGAWRSARTPSGRLPGTATCLACGSTNPLGLQLRFDYNDRFVWRGFEPRLPYEEPGGGLHPALAPILLDEIGWWLGALDQGECGVTTEIAVALVEPLPREPLLVLGDRAAVRRTGDSKGRYSRAEALLLTRSGTPLAAATVRFAGSRVYSKRLLPVFATESGEGVYRLFPRYAPPGDPERARDGSSSGGVMGPGDGG